MCSRWAYKINGGLISGWAYIWNNIFDGKWMGLVQGRGLKTGGGEEGFKVGFYSTCHYCTKMPILTIITIILI